MILHRGRRVVAALLLSVVLLTTACSPKAPGRFDQAQKKALNKNAVKPWLRMQLRVASLINFSLVQVMATSVSLPKRKRLCRSEVEKRW